MPKDACRLKLLVTGVKIERLQEITVGDVKKEGVKIEPQAVYDMLSPTAAQAMAQDQIKKFINLWDRINLGRGYGWESNPYVWVVEFQPVTK